MSLHTAKPVITAKPTSMLVSPTILETAHVTDPHAIDLFHTHDPHDSAHGHMHSHPNMIPQDLAHQPLVLHQSDIGFTSKSRQTKVPIVNTRATTAAPPSKQQANDQLNLIVGDWTGAEKTLAGPPPPPKTDLALDHPHGHHHFQSHVHGVSKAPSIPPPPPLSGHSESSQQGNKTMTNDFRNQPPTSEKFTVDKGAFGTANNNAGNVDTPMLINNLPTANTGHLNHDPSPIFGPGNLQDLNISFINILDKNLSKHLGKYQSALVYLYDPFQSKSKKQGSGLDIVEISLNLTDLPLQLLSGNQSNRVIHKESNTNGMEGSPNQTFDNISETSNKVSKILHTGFDVSTPLPSKQTQIDSSNLTSSTVRLSHSSTPSLLSLTTDVQINVTVNSTSSYKNHSSFRETFSMFSKVYENASFHESASVNTSVTSTAMAIVNVTEASFTTSELTTLAGPTTLDPDYLADLAEAQEEAAQQALELAELAEGISTTAAGVKKVLNANITTLPTVKKTTSSVV